MAAQELQLR